MLKEQNSIVDCQTVIIGGGFYGLRIALFLHQELGVNNIVVLEKENSTMSRASYVNQARVHNGYHYPRSVLTGHRSAVNFPRFTQEYAPAIKSDFTKYYGIAKHLSKVNSLQFKRFCEKIGVDIEEAPEEIVQMFNSSLVESVFLTKEYAFDSNIVRDMLVKKIRNTKGIALHTGQVVQRIASSATALQVITDRSVYKTTYVLNCTYSNINMLHRASGLPLARLKHEVTEICLVKMPRGLEDFSITMMDGPFFSIMPFPSRKLHSLSHVRYTPHESWMDNGSTALDRIDTHKYLERRPFKSNYRLMYNDAVRFMPTLKDMEYVESILEVKTVLVKSEDDDSRPILYRSDFGLDNYVCIMGGKVDNIYDVFEELKGTYGKD